MAKNEFFKYGDLKKIADHAGTTVSRLSDVFARRRNVRIETAKTISVSIFIVLDKTVPWVDIMNAKNTTHPAFTGKPLNKRKV